MFWLKPNLQYISFIGLKPDAIDVSRQLANWTNLDFFLFFGGGRFVGKLNQLL